MNLRESHSIASAINQLHKVIRLYGNIATMGYLLIDTGYQDAQEIDNLSCLILGGI